MGFESAFHFSWFSIGKCLFGGMWKKAPPRNPTTILPGKIVPCWTSKKREAFGVWGRWFFPVQFRFGWFFGWTSRSFLGVCYIDPPIQDPNVMTATRDELQNPLSTTTKTKNNKGKPRYPISAVVDKTLLITVAYWAHLVGSLTTKLQPLDFPVVFFCCRRSWLRNWTSYVLDFPEILAVSVLETRRGPGWFSARRRPSNCWAKNTTRRRTRSIRWKGNLVEIQWVHCVDLSNPPTQGAIVHHQDDIVTFLGSRESQSKPSFVTVTPRGIDPIYCW